MAAHDHLKGDLQTNSLASAPVLDPCEQLLLEHPELTTFREGDTWVIDQRRLSSFLAAAQILPSVEAVSHADDLACLFGDQRTYTPAKPRTFIGHSVKEQGYLDIEDDLTPCIGLEVLRKLGAHELADHTEGLLDDLDTEDYNKTTDLQGAFLDTHAIRRFVIEPPDGVEIERTKLGPNLLQSAEGALKEELRAGRDKVSQRRLVSELAVEGLHQPSFVDVRELTPRQPLAVFQRTNLSALPVDWITEAPAGEKRILVFEDAAQGFMIINDGEDIFLHSDNEYVAALISGWELDRPDLPKDIFPSAYKNFCEQMSGEKGPPVYLFEKELIGAPDRDNFLEAAHSLINHGSNTFIKSTRTAGGQLVVNLQFDPAGEPGIHSNSPEIGHALLSLVSQHKNVKFWRDLDPSNHADSTHFKIAASKLQELCTMPGSLKHLMMFMEAPIIEESIPVMRLEKGNESLKIEFRICLQGEDELSIAGHYAKASPNEVAANISLGGGALKTYEAIEGLHQQMLSGLFSKEEILQRSQGAYASLMSIALEFGEKYANELRQRGLGGAVNMRDFAVDICPVWDKKTDSMAFYLLEVQYGYGYKGLQDVDPEMAATVTAFKEKLAETLKEQAKKRAQQERDRLGVIRMLGF